MSTPSSCCAPKAGAAASPCGPPASAPKAPSACPPAASPCCGPPAAAPAATSCCAPPAAASSACCAAPQAAATPCCPPPAAAAPAASTCCAPAPAPAAKTACCPPPPAALATASPCGPPAAATRACCPPALPHASEPEPVRGPAPAPEPEPEPEPVRGPAPEPEPEPEPAPAPAPTGAATTSSEIKSTVKQYYGEQLKTTEDLKTSACKTCIAPPLEIRSLLKEVPDEVTSKFYGCGTPLPLGVTGLRVLDLGSGSGRDCYVAARLVGEHGFVTGVDMTPSQLDVANRNLEQYSREVCKYAAPNMKFIHGEIEYLDKAGLPDDSQDIVISNCVINLSPDKPRVLREVYRVLAAGGEMYFSDVYCDRRLSPEIRSHPVMIGECLGGALYIQDFLRICREVGFTDPRCLSMEPISVDDPELKAVAADARFFSLTFRLFKIGGGKLEGPPAENYGQTATYSGRLRGYPQHYDLDSNTRLLTGVAVPVDGNTAAILSDSWLSKFFYVAGDRSRHLGQFEVPALGLPASLQPAAAAAGAGAACCGPKGCC